MLLLVASLLAFAATDVHCALVGGRSTYINYNSDCGVWNNNDDRQGLVLEECCPVDASFPGNPWQQLSLNYTQGSVHTHFSGNSGTNTLHPPGCPTYNVVSERILDDGTKRVGIEHVMKMGLVTLTKREEWGFFDKTIKITFQIRYDVNISDKRTCRPIDQFSVMHAVDPDHDLEPFGLFSTYNDVTFNGPDGLWAEATGPRSCKTLGYGICSNERVDGTSDEVGFTRWLPTTPAKLDDPDSTLMDDTVHYQHRDQRKFYCGEQREFFFFVAWDRCNAEARKRFLVAHDDFCKVCYKPPVQEADQPRPRCNGDCPCQGSVPKGCNCTYKCEKGPDHTPVDVIHTFHEYEAVLGSCDGRKRKKRQSGDLNVLDTPPSAELCANVKADLEAVKLRRKRTS